MDDHRFDDLARGLAAAVPRRGFAFGLAGGALALWLAASADDASARKRRKKKRKPSCTPSCFNKVCGQDNGCGGTCTVPLGCDSDEACIDGECRANSCVPACTGNKVCQPNGSCACPSGLKECSAATGFPGFCHECCIAASGTAPDPECIGSAAGPYCREDDGDLINRCGCYPGQNACGGGVCGACCDVSDCFFDVFNEGQNVDSGRDCLLANEETGELSCQCRQGFARCGTTSVCAAPDTDRLCGPGCTMDCTQFPGYVCRDERCCLPAFGSCLTSGDCCAGLACVQQTAPPFAFVCA